MTSSDDYGSTPPPPPGTGGWAPAPGAPAYGAPPGYGAPQAYGGYAPPPKKSFWRRPVGIVLTVLLVLIAASVAFVLVKDATQKHLHAPDQIAGKPQLHNAQIDKLTDSFKNQAGSLDHVIAEAYGTIGSQVLVVVGGDVEDQSPSEVFADMTRGFRTSTGQPVTLVDTPAGAGRTMRCSDIPISGVASTVCAFATKDNAGMVVVIPAKVAEGAPIARDVQEAVGGG
jgi:hypothetical protein